MPLAAFLLAIVGSLAKRVLVALGFGFISFVGFQVIKDQLGALISSSLGSMPSAVYQILALGGVVDALGIWLGAITTVISFIAFKKLAALA